MRDDRNQADCLRVIYIWKIHKTSMREPKQEIILFLQLQNQPEPLRNLNKTVKHDLLY